MVFSAGGAYSSIAAAMSLDRTLVFAHRGASAYAPMNTLPAFELAAAQGADGIELDVHLTRDGRVVVIHDFTVDSTTDGHGRVAEMSLADIKRLDAGAWFGAAFAGVRVPTLDEVFAEVGHRVLINVEIKSEGGASPDLEQAVAAIIERSSMKERIIVSSFNALVLTHFRNAMPDVPIGFLYDTAAKDVLQTLQDTGLTVEALHPHHLRLDAGLMVLARTRGWWVNTWTVNDPQRAAELRDLGVNVVMTDYPDIVRAALG